MTTIAKLFMNGRSQAVRLPVEFRFDTNEIYISRDPVSGDVVLSRRPNGWQDFFDLQRSLDIPQDFMIDRADVQPQERPAL